ncbi:MAG: xanthine dehydrogenase small subunit [Alphaproteobacteria bacterium]|nr:xanthine dehydrogenase small subunit [Alphaproteobacteria bacterium]
MRNEIRFLLGHEMRSLRSVDPTMTVLDYLRQDERLVGTKEGCNEGDCGACTVVLARLVDGGLRYEAVNACIQFVGTLDGCQLLTVEHLVGEDGSLHPVQQAMVDCHGSQCGFCTPGFVMSLFALTRHSETVPDDGVIDDVFAGNLCRCTGYAPIVRAAGQAYELKPRQDHIAAREAETIAALGRLADTETVAVGDGERRFFAPATADALAELFEANPEATIVAGSTDVGLWVTKEMRRLDTVIYLGRIAELARIEEGADGIEIGAGINYTEAMATLARHYPDMGEVIRRLGSVQIRNAGTIGGNVANGSPIGDSPPLLIAAGAMLHLRRGDARRSMPIEDFFLDYGKQDRAPGEFVEKIVVPYPAGGTRFRAYKIAKRFDQDISAVLAAFQLWLDGDEIKEARVAFGGMAATPKRAPAVEARLAGSPWNEDTVQAAMAALEQDFTPITDWRASADYRLRVSQNLLMRCYVETTDATQDTRLVGDRSLAHV